MQVTIKTEQLQAMVAKAVKGVGNNKLIPITSMIKVQVKDSVLELETTDGTNYLYIIEKVPGSEDFYAVIPVDVFAKLVARITCPEITLECAEGALIVTGNGEYTIALPLDEDGAAITYPDPSSEVYSNICIKVPTAVLRTVYSVVKPALAVTLEVPCHTGYYCGNNVIGTDGFKICALEANLFNTPKLINPEAMSLLTLIEDETTTVLVQNNILLFTSSNCVVYTRELDGVQDYPVGPINSLLEQEFKWKCELDTAAVLSALDRLALFVSPYDKNAIQLEFAKEYLTIFNNQVSSSEDIPYIKAPGIVETETVQVSIEILMEQLRAIAVPTFELHFGRSNAIKLTSDGGVTQIIALMA